LFIDEEEDVDDDDELAVAEAPFTAAYLLPLTMKRRRRRKQGLPVILEPAVVIVEWTTRSGMARDKGVLLGWLWSHRGKL
jgi:hypothetical protein